MTTGQMGKPEPKSWVWKHPQMRCAGGWQWCCCHCNQLVKLWGAWDTEMIPIWILVPAWDPLKPWSFLPSSCGQWVLPASLSGFTLIGGGAPSSQVLKVKACCSDAFPPSPCAILFLSAASPFLPATSSFDGKRLLLCFSYSQWRHPELLPLCDDTCLGSPNAAKERGRMADISAPTKLPVFL